MTGGGSEVAETQQSKILSDGWQCSFFLANEKEEQRLNSSAQAIFFNVSHIASLRQIGERTDCEEYRSHDKSLCTLICLSISVPFYLFSPFSMDTSVSYHATADTAAGTVMYIFTISRLSCLLFLLHFPIRPFAFFGRANRYTIATRSFPHSTRA